MNFKHDTAATNVFLICSFLLFFLGGHSGSSSSVSSYPSILCNINMHVLLHCVWKHLSGIFTLPRLHMCKPFLTSLTPSCLSEDSFLILFIPNEHLNFSERLSAYKPFLFLSLLWVHHKTPLTLVFTHVALPALSSSLCSVCCFGSVTPGI